MVAAGAEAVARTPLLPWLADPLRQALDHSRGHALLVHGPAGVGQFELALALATAWLCEAPRGRGEAACGRCAGCRLVAARTHPDLLVLLPEVLREALGWAADGEGEGDTGGEKGSKRKPSKDIRVDDVRRAIGYAQTSSARGRGKVVVLHPAERMNPIASNALLKTLEEPPGAARLVLSSAAPQALLPTVRSRCQAIALGLPDPAVVQPWLEHQGVKDAAVVLGAAGGQPLDAVAWTREGFDGSAWKGLCKRIAAGDGSAVSGWPPSRILDALQKLCHDLMSLSVGAQPRYFDRSDLPGSAPRLAPLAAWAKTLREQARQVEHPFHAPLWLDAQLLRAREALGAALG